MTIIARKLVSIKGDAMDIQFNMGQSIASWEIRAEIWDTAESENFIQKANIEVSGGSASEIEITNESSGIFVVHIDSGETTDFIGDVNMEVEVVDSDSKRWTIFQDSITMKKQRITWTNPS